MYLLTVSENILYFVCGLGVLQGVLLGGLIYFHPKSDRSVNVYLAFYVVAISAIIALPFIFKVVGWQNSFFVHGIPVLTGPLLYFYLRSFRETLNWKKILPHLIPFFLFFFLAYWNTSVTARKYPDAVAVPPEMITSPLTFTMTLIKLFHQIIYYFLARKVLISYQRSITYIFSETSRIDLKWARLLLNGFLFLVLTFLVVFFPLMLLRPEYFNILLLISMAIGTPYVYLVTYKGILQPAIWQAEPGINKQMLEEELNQAEHIKEFSVDISKVKNGKQAVNSQRIEEIVERITSLMEQEKLYQETELTLPQLAERLNVPTYQVSLALNEGMKKSFYDVINSYRVNEAKRLLLDTRNNNFTILSVGFEAGFNSKTTFNTVFKKFTGLTPTAYREAQKSMFVTA